VFAASLSALAAQPTLTAQPAQGEWPTKYAPCEAPEGFNAFHGAIAVDELCRCASGGMVWAVCGGLGIGLPPVLHFGSPELQDRVAPGCLAGDKFICLAITEPLAGSDVAAIRTTAVKDPSGKFYVVNGEKKWITNGVFADFFTVAVRTGGPGAGGISLLLVERGPGVTTKQMDCQGVWASGTTYITFDDVKVPVENLIGAENDGFKMIMCACAHVAFCSSRGGAPRCVRLTPAAPHNRSNFNQERMGIVYQALRFARVCLEESFLYAHSRKTFGKRLIDHPVIRMKIAEMARHVEATQAMSDVLTHQMIRMPREQVRRTTTACASCAARRRALTQMPPRRRRCSSWAARLRC
jgi:alkylation response protein AidB-like acyl-CoA dehydrogenase